MSSTATCARFADGRRHFQHGPIDLVIDATGEAAAVDAAHAAAWQTFDGLLAGLVAELAVLKQPVGDRPADRCPLQGRVARRMWQACRALSPRHCEFLTPMAAVAGAVAEDVIAAYRRPGVARAYVNNGGDIALHLAPHASTTIGLYVDIGRFDARDAALGVTSDCAFRIDAAMPIRGVATSGWRGRSFSLGIADSVTVFAKTAPAADAAATVIANAVDVDDPRIVRRPADELKDDTDLGAILVTVDVPRLPRRYVEAALANGVAKASDLSGAGLIEAALLVCQGAARSVGPMAHLLHPLAEASAA